MKSSFTLVTGGAGFIGSHLCDELTVRGENVLVIDNLSTGKESNLPSRGTVEFLKGDVSDPSTVKAAFERFSVDRVYHLAAVASVQESVKHPARTHAVNFDSTLLLLEESRARQVKSFFFASSAAVYGGAPKLPCREDGAVSPMTPYGIDKYASERYALSYASLYGLNAFAARFFNVFGPRQDPASPYSGVLSIFSDRMRKEKPSLILFGDGKQTRDFVYVKDVVGALVHLTSHPEAAGRVFNVGCGKAVSLLDVIHELERLSGRKAELKFEAARPGDIRHSRADISALKRTGFTPKVSFEAGLAEYWAELER